MRQAYGGTWLIQLVLVFIILFAVYIVLTLDYSKTIKVKNEAISIIEKYDGLNEKSITTLNNYLVSNGYKTMGGCGERNDYYGAADLNASELEEAEKGKKYYYCIKKYKGNKNTYYYQISLFYNFNINFLGVSTYYTVKGTTSSFEPHDDAAYGGSPNYIPVNPTPTPEPTPKPTPDPEPDTPITVDNDWCKIRSDSNAPLYIYTPYTIQNAQIASGDVLVSRVPESRFDINRIGIAQFEFAIRFTIEKADGNRYDGIGSYYTCNLKKLYFNIDSMSGEELVLTNTEVRYRNNGDGLYFFNTTKGYLPAVDSNLIMYAEDYYGNKAEKKIPFKPQIY